VPQPERGSSTRFVAIPDLKIERPGTLLLWREEKRQDENNYRCLLRRLRDDTLVGDRGVGKFAVVRSELRKT
jgi:hypothetical protein